MTQSPSFIPSTNLSGEVRSLRERVNQLEHAGYIQMARQAADLTLIGEYSDVPGMTLTITDPGTYLVSAVVSLDSTIVAGQIMYAQLFVSGVAQAGEVQIDMQSTGGRYQETGVWLVKTTTRGSIVNLRAKRDTAGGAAVVKATDTMLAVIGFPGAAST